MPPGADLARAIARLERQPSVRYAELDAAVEPLHASNDPCYLSDTTAREHVEHVRRRGHAFPERVRVAGR